MSTLAELREEIKVGARADGDNILDVLIDDLINELLLVEAVGQKLFQFFNITAILSVDVASGIAFLPGDFLSLHEVIFTSGSASWNLTSSNEVIQASPLGYATKPNAYTLSNLGLLLQPFSGITNSDVVTIRYFFKPALLVADTDAFPVEKLEPLIKREAIRRILLWHEKDQSAAGLVTDIQAARGSIVFSEREDTPTV